MVRRPSLLPVLVLLAALAVPGAAAGATSGALSDLQGTGSCVTVDGSADPGPGACRAEAVLGTAGQFTSVAVAPDGRFVAIADDSGVILQYARDPQTGLLSVPAGQRCWTADGSGGCGDYRGQVEGDGDALAFSADGRFLYATDESATPGVLVFARDAATGALTQLPGTAGCLTADGAGESGPGTCTNIRGPAAPNAVRLSDDQRFVYVTDFGGGGILSFARNAATGELTQLPGTQGCISQDGSSEDGAATCQDARLVSDDRALTLAPDGRHAFAADIAKNGVEVFDRDPATGVLTVRSDQASCFTQTGALGCRDGRGLSRVYQVAVAKDGRTIYAAGELPSGVAVLHVDPATGELTQPAGQDGCFSRTGNDGDAGTTCTATDALGNSYGILTGQDGHTLYALSRSHGIDAYAIDPATGLLRALPGTDRCVSGDGAGVPTPGRCTDMKALQSAYAMAFGPGGTTAYVIDAVRPSLSAVRVEVPPVCSPVSAATAFGTPVALTLPCSDPNGDPFTRQIVSPPAGLSLGALGADGALTATPATGFSGTASFTYTATDAGGAGDPATATVTVGEATRTQGAATPSGDRTKPAVKLGKLRITKKGIALTLTLSEPATVRASLKGRFTAKGKARTLAQATTRAKAGKVTVTLKTTKAGTPLKRLKGKRLKALRPTLTLSATDAAGNRTTASAVRAKLTR